MIRAYVIHPNITTSKHSTDEIYDKVNEAKELALALNLEIFGHLIVNLSHIRPGSFLGTGKLAELKQFTQENDIELIIFNCSLTPTQHRQCEKLTNVKVLDRTALILEIFGARAKTKEGKLQVELAHLIYQKSRLVRSWTHLERQRGGGSFMGGPGESQIEADRRQISQKIKKIERDLEKVKKTRSQQRKSRLKAPFPVCALVGYTNAGKSTIFNKLTSSQALAKDFLFATLDPKLKMINLSLRKKIIISDTVGFISDLPTQLIEAFHATLEEVQLADIILFVNDSSHKDLNNQHDVVLEILSKLNIDQTSNKVFIHIYNKIDKLTDDKKQILENYIKSKYNLDKYNLDKYNLDKYNLDKYNLDKYNLDKKQQEISLSDDSLGDGSLGNGSYENPYIIFCSAISGENFSQITATLEHSFSLLLSKWVIEIPFIITNHDMANHDMANHDMANHDMANIGKFISQLKKYTVIKTEDNNQNGFYYCVETNQITKNKIQKEFPQYIWKAFN